MMRKISIPGRGKIDQAKDRLKKTRRPQGSARSQTGRGPSEGRPEEVDQLLHVLDEVELDGGQHAAVIGSGHSYGTSHAHRGWP